MCLVLGLMPTMSSGVFAVSDSDLLSIQVGDEIEAYGMAENAEGEGWSYDAASVTLTLTNFTGHSIDSSTTDALCGGPLALAMESPLILSRNTRASIAQAYAEEAGLHFAYVLGGPDGEKLISDISMDTIMGLQ